MSYGSKTLSNTFSLSRKADSLQIQYREGYRIPDTLVGRGTEFLTPRMGGVQNS